MLSTPKKQDSNCTISYILERLNTLDMTQLIPFFANLPIDPYLEGNYRFRRLSHFRISDRCVVQLPHVAMFQSKTHNPLLGNVVREYAELDPELIKCPDFQALILEFFEFCQRCSTSDEVGVHQIRITADQGVGNPAPEGIHRDGVDIIGIVCVNRDGVAGGETHLYESKDRSPVFTKVLNPGELLVVNDQQLFHFTTPIQARSPGAGVRDVFVFTCPGLPASSR